MHAYPQESTPPLSSGNLYCLRPTPQAALAQLTQAALANTPLSTLLQQAVALVASTLAVAYSKFFEARADGRALVLRAGIGWTTESAGQITVGVRDTSLAGYTLLTQQPVFVADWASETRFRQPALLRSHGITSSLCVSIHGQAHPFGILGVDSREPRHFTSSEVQFLQAVANVLAMTVERCQAQQALRAERQRLARDLHDSVTQSLYGITLYSEAAKRLLATGEQALVAEYLNELGATAQEAFQEMRLLIFELRPPVLEQAGLAAALRARLEAVEGRSHLKATLSMEGEQRLPAPIEQALYRIAQEALNNVLRHAHATQVNVLLQQTGPTVSLTISDDGDGFVLATAQSGGGLGLCGMAERIASVGGRLLVESRPGDGTQVRAEVCL